MFGPIESLLLMYLGGGLAVFLFWAACLPTRELTPHEVSRYTRWSTVASFAGLVHPGIAVAARDVLAQAAVDLPADGPLPRRHRRATTVVNAVVVLSLATAIAALAVAGVSG